MSGPEVLHMSAAQGRAYLQLICAKNFDDRPCRDPLEWDMPEKPQGSWHLNPSKRAVVNAIVADEEQKRRNACARCPVLLECRTYANTHPDVTGVLAALSDEERHEAKKKRRTA